MHLWFGLPLNLLCHGVAGISSPSLYSCVIMLAAAVHQKPESVTGTNFSRLLDAVVSYEIF